MSKKTEREKLSAEDQRWLAGFIDENTAKLRRFSQDIWFRMNLKAFNISQEELLSELYLAMTPPKIALLRETEGGVYLIMLNRCKDIIRSKRRIKRGGKVTTNSLADSETQEARLPLSSPPQLQEDLREALTGTRDENEKEVILRDMRHKNLAARGQKAIRNIYQGPKNQADEDLITLASEYTLELLQLFLESEKKGIVQEEAFRKTLDEVLEDLLEDGHLGTDFQAICSQLMLATIARIDQKYNDQERSGSQSQIGQVALQATAAHQGVLDILLACQQLREKHPLEAMAVHLNEQGFSQQEIGQKMGLDQGARRMLEHGQKILAENLGIFLKKGRAGQTSPIRSQRQRKKPNDRDGGEFS